MKTLRDTGRRGTLLRSCPPPPKSNAPKSQPRKRCPLKPKDTPMEHLTFEFEGQQTPPLQDPILVGVVGSGNLEVLLERGTDPARCTFAVTTSARGFGPIWEAVVQNFQLRHRLAGVAISINDMGATPAVVSLRLDQAAASLPSVTTPAPRSAPCS
jgi:malonate decarboxylase delta subunit